MYMYLAAKPARLTRGDLARRVNADYYGYRDEDDGVIVALEEEEEKKGQNNACEVDGVNYLLNFYYGGQKQLGPLVDLN